VKGGGNVPKSLTNGMLERLPLYLNYLKALPNGTPKNISATSIARALSMGEVNVRKDLAAISGSGKPKIGYIVSELIDEIEINLGYREKRGTVIVGAGRLGRALLDYKSFSEYGINILAAFDINEDICGETPTGKKILPLKALEEFCEEYKVQIGIITVPASAAQEVCDFMVECGIYAIWNFAPTHLNVRRNIMVQNENMAASLAVLSSHLKLK
jgi:redox-sensing transcriptional repressor